jgi:hypothetical protein
MKKSKSLVTAEKSFHNAIRYSRGMEFYGANGMGAGSQGMVEELDEADSTLTFSISNANTASAETAYLFAAAKGLDSAGDNITVSLQESSHTQIRESLKSKPFRIVGMRYIAETSSQLAKPIYIYQESASGNLERKIVTPNTYRNALNNITTQVEVLNLKIDVDVDTYLTHELLASEDITIIFHLVERVNPAAEITGRPRVQQSRNLLSLGGHFDLLGRR